MYELLLWSGTLVLTCVRTPAVRPTVFVRLTIAQAKWMILTCGLVSLYPQNVLYSDTLG